MQKTQATRNENTTESKKLYMAFELADREWKLFFTDGNKERQRSVKAGNIKKVMEEIDLAKERLRLEEDVEVVSCYEAGRDGFWLHRYLIGEGIENVVFDPSSIEVDRRKRRAKTDGIDGKKMLRVLMRYCGGEKKVCSVVRVPGVEDEDKRQLHRELETLKKERTSHSNRIGSLLKLHGISEVCPRRADFEEWLESVRLFDGSGLPGELKSRLIREFNRLQLVESQILELKQKRKEMLREGGEERISRLMALRGIGIESAWQWEREFFGWRKFRNRREVAALAGLSPTPYNSGKSRIEQGISKSGSRRVRSMAVEIAWLWMRFQPESKHTKWFQERYARGGKRMRRIGIVAVARKLLIDLWKFVEFGEVPQGAVLAG